MIFIPVGFCFYITEAEILKKKKKLEKKFCYKKEALLKK